MPVSESAQPRVYLDYAATAPLDSRLHEVMQTTSWANASSLYTEGREAAHQLEDARRRIAEALGARSPSEIIFTSGGSEADNMALRGIMRRKQQGSRSHLVVSAIEHHAVLHTADALKGEGFSIDHLAPDTAGFIQPDALEERLAQTEAQGEKTALVAVQAVNNELGTIQPVAELARAAHANGALFFCDAVQALGKVEVALEASGIDAAAFSAHKIGGLKGVGILYLRRGVPCAPFVTGGGQELGLRSGTSNVLGARCFAAAIEHAVDERARNWEQAVRLRAHLLEALESSGFSRRLRLTIPESGQQAPHILALLCDSLEGETLVLRLDNAGISASSGSACSSGSLDPSHVLSAIGIPRNRAFNSLRLSFGPGSTEADIDRFVSSLTEVLK